MCLLALLLLPFFANAATPVVESGFTTATVAVATSIDISEPTGLATNDLALIFVTNNTGNTNTDEWDNGSNKPTGFTLIEEEGTTTSDCHTGAFYRIITGSESWPITIPWTSNNNTHAVAYAVRVTGIDTSTPLHITGTTFDDNTGTTHAVPSLTTTLNNSLIFYVLGAQGGDMDPVSVSGTGWSESAENTAGTTGTGATLTWGTRELATAGASGAATVTTNSSDGTNSWQFAIAEATATGIVPIIQSHKRRRTIL